MECEEWRLYGPDGWYEVSNIGNVRSWRIRGSRIKRQIQPYMLSMTPSGQGRNIGRGYLQVNISGYPHSGSRRISVHRLVALTWVGPCPSPKHQVAHNDGDCRNNRADNLRWATAKENHADKRRHGTLTMGSAVHCATITEDDAAAIREEYAQDNSRGRQKALSEKYGTSRTQIWRIVHGQTWRGCEQ